MMNPKPFRGCFLGLCTIDVIYNVAELPARNSKNVALRQLVLAGGPATNAAATFAYLGGHARLLTVLGTNPVAELIRQDLEALGVQIVDLEPTFNEPPTISSILVTEKNGERVVVSANATRLPVPACFDTDLLNDSSILLVDGHFPAASQELARHAKMRGTTVVLDSGSWKPGMEELLRHIDIAICSQDFIPSAGQSEISLVSYMFQLGIKKIAFTAGEDPIRYYLSDDKGSIPVPQAAAADTLGAGDVFHGAFCYRHVGHPLDFIGNLRFAAAIAAKSCQHFGTRAWMKDS
jgi:sugar/nucleoside kinase (ribokinase family)